MQGQWNRIGRRELASTIMRNRCGAGNASGQGREQACERSLENIMPLGKTPEEWWQMILRFLKFAARVPVAGLVISAAAFLSFVLFMVFFRGTQWMWVHWLSEPW